jgi:hypothetical protein
MLLSFHVNFSFSGTVVLLQKIFEICFLYKHMTCKNSFPILAPPDPWDSWFEHTLIYSMSGSFHINYNFPGPIFYINTYKRFPLLRPHPTPEGYDFNDLWYTVCLEPTIWFTTFLILWLFRRRFLKICHIKIGKNSFPFCGPTRPRGTWFKKNLILYYIRKVSCKFQLFCASNFWEETFLMTPTPFSHFWIYLPFEEDFALYFNKLKSPLPKVKLYQVWLNLACWFWRRL